MHKLLPLLLDCAFRFLLDDYLIYLAGWPDRVPDVSCLIMGFIAIGLTDGNSFKALTEPASASPCLLPRLAVCCYWLMTCFADYFIEDKRALQPFLSLRQPATLRFSHRQNASKILTTFSFIIARYHSVISFRLDILASCLLKLAGGIVFATSQCRFRHRPKVLIKVWCLSPGFPLPSHRTCQAFIDR